MRYEILHQHTYHDGDDENPVLLVGVDYLRLHLGLSKLVGRGSLSPRLFSRGFRVHLARRATARTRSHPMAEERGEGVIRHSIFSD